VVSWKMFIWLENVMLMVGCSGFVRYGKVRDVDKLLKAVNNVWFGDCKVVAKVANFDRFGNTNKARGNSDDGEKRKLDEEKIIEGEKRENVGKAKVDDGESDGTVKGRGAVVGGAILRKVEIDEEELFVDAVPVNVEKNNVVVQPKMHLIPKYRSSEKDLSWASKGVVLTMLNGEVIPVLQRRIYDAGFETINIIPLGADKVFLRSTDDGDVSNILSEAANFFNNFFLHH